MQILEIAFSGIMGTVIGVILGYVLEKRRDKSREDQERRAIIAKIHREVSHTLDFLKSVLETLSNPHLQSVIQTAHFVASIAPPGYSVFSLKAVRNAPPLNGALDEQLSTFSTDLARLESLGREIQLYIPPPGAVPPSELLRPEEKNRLDEVAKSFVDKARQLIAQAIQHGEQIQQQLQRRLTDHA